MRALVHESFGEPEDVLHVADRPDPEPGPGEVLVRTLLTPIHNHDVWTIRGTYGTKPELPAIGGTEALGVVERLGDGVTALEVGQRVVAAGTPGVWAERFTASAAGLMPVPASIPDESAAQLIAMPFSAVSVLDEIGLAAGDVLVQNAANGAVGRLVAQLGTARGLTVVGLVRRAAAARELRAQGIEDVVSTDADGWQDRVRAIAGERPVRAAIDSVGGDAAGDLLRLLGTDGRLVIFGTMASADLRLPAGELIFKQATVQGFWGSVVSARTPPEIRAARMREIVAGVLEGTVTLPVEGAFGFGDLDTALAAQSRPGRAGKVLLRP